VKTPCTPWEVYPQGGFRKEENTMTLSRESILKTEKKTGTKKKENINTTDQASVSFEKEKKERVHRQSGTCLTKGRYKKKRRKAATLRRGPTLPGRAAASRNNAVGVVPRGLEV